MLARAGSVKRRTLEAPGPLHFLTRPSDGPFSHVDRPLLCLGLGSLTPSSKASRHRSPWSMSRAGPLDRGGTGAQHSAGVGWVDGMR